MKLRRICKENFAALSFWMIYCFCWVVKYPYFIVLHLILLFIVFSAEYKNLFLTSPQYTA